jgi:nitroimidazol reductase NimA-like FMN-containing flavoprotein (pyridoxamine 5'-phosphate oxidase superfamily)
MRNRRFHSPRRNRLSQNVTKETQMDDAIRRKILALLDEHRIMTIATVRPDGWPQATTVGYAHDGLALYFLCGIESQKAANIARDDRVSVTVDHDTPQVVDIAGLSMAGHAHAITDTTEAERALKLLAERYPPQEPPLAMPSAADVRIVRVDPTVISLLDYSKGFGHTDLVTC